MSDIEIFNPQTLKEKITEQVQQSFSSLIPQEAFEQLVDKEIEEFFNSEVYFKIEHVKDPIPGHTYYTQYNEYNRLSTPITPFKAIVWKVCHDITVEKLNRYFEVEKEKIKQQSLDLLSKELEGSISKNVELIMIEMQKNQMNNILSQCLSLMDQRINDLVNKLNIPF